MLIKLKNHLETLKIVMLFWLILGIPALAGSYGVILLLAAGKFQITEPLWLILLKLSCYSGLTCLCLGFLTWIIFAFTKRPVPEVMLFMARETMSLVSKLTTKGKGGDK